MDARLRSSGDRAAGFYPACRGFESYRGRHTTQLGWRVEIGRLGYSTWLSHYRADPAAVHDAEPGHSGPIKYGDCTSVRLEFRVRGTGAMEVEEALLRLAPPGTVASEPKMIDECTADGVGHCCAAVAYRVDWEWAES